MAAHGMMSCVESSITPRTACHRHAWPSRSFVDNANAVHAQTHHRSRSPWDSGKPAPPHTCSSRAPSSPPPRAPAPPDPAPIAPRGSAPPRHHCPAVSTRKRRRRWPHPARRGSAPRRRAGPAAAARGRGRRRAGPVGPGRWSAWRGRRRCRRLGSCVRQVTSVLREEGGGAGVPAMREAQPYRWMAKRLEVWRDVEEVGRTRRIGTGGALAVLFEGKSGLLRCSLRCAGSRRGLLER